MTDSDPGQYYCFRSYPNIIANVDWGIDAWFLEDE